MYHGYALRFARSFSLILNFVFLPFPKHLLIWCYRCKILLCYVFFARAYVPHTTCIGVLWHVLWRSFLYASIRFLFLSSVFFFFQFCSFFFVRLESFLQFFSLYLFSDHLDIIASALKDTEVVFEDPELFLDDSVLFSSGRQTYNSIKKSLFIYLSSKFM